MDKKNTTIGVLLLLAAIGVLFLGPRLFPPAPVAPVETPPPVGETQPAGISPADPGSLTQGPEVAPSTPAVELPAAAPAAAQATSLLAPAVGSRPGEQLVSLTNEFVEIRFTNYGGAIADVAMKKHPATKNGETPYVLNASHAAAALSLQGFPGLDDNATYVLVSHTADTVVWRTTLAGQVEVTRTFSLSSDASKRDLYLVRHETSFRNLTGQPVNTPVLAFNLGTAEPVDANDPGMYLNVGAYNGDDDEFIARSAFVPGFFAKTFSGDRVEKQEISMPGPVVWGSVKNQFFTTVLTPDKPGTAVVAQRVQLPLHEGDPRPRVGITGRLLMEPLRLEPGTPQTLGFDFYAGPKEYGRLSKMGKREDLVMQFGFFGFFAKLLLTLMTALHGYVYANWGVAIIGTTLIIRGLMWPITASAARSAKRMTKIQGPMKALQEKYKDNRNKLNEEMLKLFKENKVNPVGGCLPLFVQIPIFFGLFTMLRSASELRFAEFLWIPDLSAPDTIAHIFGFPLNIMPLLMGASMVIQMRMTPTPTTDNMQAKMMKFMPYMVTFMCYSFSSGLAVYWTASNLFSIFQQWVTNRRKDPADLSAPGKPGAADHAKPVRDAKVSSVADRKKKK
jgi:YidC/Oxa1 family membrane protein insertase